MTNMHDERMDAARKVVRELAMTGLDARPEQIDISAMLDDVMARNDGSVGFLEAPTATGKTIVMARTALETSLGLPEDESFVIATPSIEVCVRTVEACDRLVRDVPAYRGVRTRIVLGRQEFVSHQRMVELATALAGEGRETEADAISRWLDEGAPGPSTAYPPYTRQGLLHATGGTVEAPDWALLNQVGQEDRADGAHRSQFEHAGVIVVTHAMLARDLVKRYVEAWRERKRSGAPSAKDRRWDETLLELVALEADAERLLPLFRRLIVDEAHLLEDNVRHALSTTVSIRQLTNHMKAVSNADSAKVPPRAAAAMQSAYEKLTSMKPTNADRVRIDWNEPKGFEAVLGDVSEALARVKRPKKGSIDDADLERASRALREALNHRNSVSTSIVWSPGRSYPSLGIGPRSLGGRLAFMWRTLKSAALVSATLYTDNKDGPSIRFMAEILGVGPDQRMTFEPIRPTWQVEPVTFHVPAVGSTLPAPAHDDEGNRRWIDSVSERIAGLCGTSAKGVLVLCRSRAMTSAVVETMIADGFASDRIVDGTTAPLSQLRARYEGMSRSGHRPVWITQGPAWTGLDLPDDTIDTLVIPALPFPPPRPGSTAGAEPSYDGEQVARMMITLKQGVGRLVRNRNATPKRAYLLDTRINGKGPAAAAFGVLRGYRTIRES